jgi:glycosyltransferase involved in cell wall biosynthesis
MGNTGGPPEASVAVLHDEFSVRGGAEKLVIAAARALDAPVFTSFVAPEVEIPDDVEVTPLKQSKYSSSLVSRLPGSSKLAGTSNFLGREVRFINQVLDFSDADELLGFDVIVGSGNASKHYTPTTEQKIVHYTHTPPRYYYDLFRYATGYVDDYPLLPEALKVYCKLLRVFDKEANDCIDRFVANSEVVRDRVRRFYDEEAEVIYPPVPGDWRNEGDEGYFVTWSRLDPKKRTDMIIEAFAELDEQLIVAGTGPEEARLAELAEGHANIQMRGYVDDIEGLVSRATAVVYAPLEEDFGLVGAEALRAGKPLIGVDEGFTRYQVTPETGITFSPSVDALVDAIESFDPAAFDPEEIQAVAERYEYEQFEAGIRRIVEEVSE